MAAQVNWQRTFDNEVKKHRALQNEIQDLAISQSKLGTQENELELVKSELALLEPSAKVYKLIGPLLTPQDVSEAQETVKKRLEFVKGEMERGKKLEEEKHKELQKVVDTITRMQQAVQMMQQQAQAMQQQQQQQKMQQLKSSNKS